MAVAYLDTPGFRSHFPIFEALGSNASLHPQIDRQKRLFRETSTITTGRSTTMARTLSVAHV